MIHIICGTCGTSKGYKTAADGELSLPAAEEARLVARKVAAYATRPVISETHGAPPVSPSEPPKQPDVPLDTPAAEAPAQPEDSEETARLERLPKADLEQMAQDMGLDISGVKNKHDLAALIASADAESEGDVVE